MPFPLVAGEQVGLADADIVLSLLQKQQKSRERISGIFFQDFQESLSVGQVEADKPFLVQCHYYDSPFSESSQ